MCLQHNSLMNKDITLSTASSCIYITSALPSESSLLVYQHSSTLQQTERKKKQKRMEINRMYYLVFPFLLLNILILHNHASAAAIFESPAPQPQPNNGSNGSNSIPSSGTTEGSLHPQECGGRCGVRCSKTAYKKPCMFFCQKCCAKCLCVPSGTYGNKQSCPCYNNWKTKRGGPKCP
ncbi:Protein GAST1 [Linum grandiflorum]